MRGNGAAIVQLGSLGMNMRAMYEEIAVQSVDAHAAKRMAAFHACFMHTGSVHHDILCQSECGAVAAATSAYVLAQLRAQLHLSSQKTADINLTDCH